MKSSFLQRIKTKVDLLHEQPPKPTTKEHQESFGKLKSSDDPLEVVKKEKKKSKKNNTLNL